MTPSELFELLALAPVKGPELLDEMKKVWVEHRHQLMRSFSFRILHSSLVVFVSCSFSSLLCLRLVSFEHTVMMILPRATRATTQLVEVYPESFLMSQLPDLISLSSDEWRTSCFRLLYLWSNLVFSCLFVSCFRLL